MGLFKKDRKNDVKVSIARPKDSELKAILKQQSHVPKNVLRFLIREVKIMKDGNQKMRDI